MSKGRWLEVMLVKPTSLGVCKPEDGDRYLTIATVIDPSMCARKHVMPTKNARFKYCGHVI
jgi:hypothetical protein